jgi:hypothetical protein
MVASASNLQLRVRATGAKAWLYRKQIEGKRSRMSLGLWPIITLAKAKARAKAGALDAAAYDDVDILAGRKKAQRSSVTFGEAAEVGLENRQDVTPTRVKKL